jgi:hypothetical protein
MQVVVLMADSYTNYYKLFKPDETSSSINSPATLDATWTKIEGIPGPDIIATGIPPVGVYNIYDRVYVQDIKDVLLLVVKDDNWGEYWRPIYNAIGPWINVPNTALNRPGWSNSILTGVPWQIAMDNRGRCYWRGATGINASVTNTSTLNFIKDLPAGLRPARHLGWVPIGTNTINVTVAATGYNAYQSAFLYLNKGGLATDSAIRVRGGNGSINPGIFYFTGAVDYDLGTFEYTSQ